MTKRLYTGSVTILALAMLAGCGQSGSSETRERELENYAAQYGVNADVTVDENGEVSSVTVNSPSGGVAGSNLELPSGFPADVVLHPSENIYSVTPVPGGGYSIAALSDASIADLSAWHRREMQQRGWSEQPGGGGPLAFMKNGRLASINFTPNGDSVAVQIMTMTIPG